ncbi:unnamed protein product [Microthlaspi erraticum]|uniref:F-box domain-containing protein n=1 Tax=Microthlaspi erraticum TaxID=1685480 RepID=A0A6D2JLJ7_9BRAS|nr:unnamed protein product [Microthlaspi erraticum]
MSAQRVSKGDSTSRDLISTLPDEVLGKILSLVPTKLATSTSVLSKRWRNLLSLVENLEFSDAIGDPRGFSDFVDKTLALLTTSSIIKRFSLNCEHKQDKTRVDTWIRTVLKRGFSELHLQSKCMHFIETDFFTSNTLVKLTMTLSDTFRTDGITHGVVFFPKLKTLSLVLVGLAGSAVYEYLISGSPVLEELFVRYVADLYSAMNQRVLFNTSTIVSSLTVKRLAITYSFPAKLDLRFSGERVLDADENCIGDTCDDDDEEDDEDEDDDDEDEDDDADSGEDDDDDSDSDESEDDEEEVSCDVTDLVAGISNVKTLHLSSDSLEVFHYDCKSMPVFHNLLTLSIESDKEKGWQVLPLLLNNSPSLETLVIKGLVHKVTDKCGDVCVCVTKKKKKTMEVCCLSTCQVKVLNILAYGGSLRELKQMRHFLGNLKCLETVEVKAGVEVDRRQGSNYTRITNALTKLPRVSSKCQLHFV